MTDNDILDEFETIVRQGRNFGTWDRERLRAVVAELSKRKLLTRGWAD